MARSVRFTKDFDHWPTPSILTPFKKGEERRITEAQYAAASAAGAVELIDGEGSEQGAVASEADSDPGGNSKGNSRRSRR